MTWAAVFMDSGPSVMTSTQAFESQASPSGVGRATGMPTNSMPAVWSLWSVEVGNGLTHLVKAHCPGVYHGEHLDKSGAEVRAIRTGD